MPGRAISSVAVDSAVAGGMRPADWNSGESNNAMYRDPAELAWERSQMANEQEKPTNPNPAEADVNGSAAVQQPEVPKRKRGRPPKSKPDQSARAAGSVDVLVPDVSRDRNPHEAGVQKARESRADRGRETPQERGNLKPAGDAESGWRVAQKSQAELGFVALERFLREAPLAEAFALFNDCYRKIIDMAHAIEERRQGERNTQNSCSYCDHKFTLQGTDMPHSRRAFDLPNGVMRVAITCKKGTCIDKFEEEINAMAQRSRANMHE